jgi:hypothetical protein
VLDARSPEPNYDPVRHVWVDDRCRCGRGSQQCGRADRVRRLPVPAVRPPSGRRQASALTAVQDVIARDTVNDGKQPMSRLASIKPSHPPREAGCERGDLPRIRGAGSKLRLCEVRR